MRGRQSAGLQYASVDSAADDMSLRHLVSHRDIASRRTAHSRRQRTANQMSSRQLVAMSLAHRAFQRDADQLLRFDGELHRQLLDDVLDEAVDDQRDRLFFGDAALHDVELLVLGNLRRRRLVLELRRRVLGFHVGHGVRAALVADQQRVAVGEVAGVGRLAVRRDLAAIGVLREAGGDALGDDAARRVLAEMDHLGAAVDLLIAVRHGDRIELALANRRRAGCSSDISR